MQISSHAKLIDNTIPNINNQYFPIKLSQITKPDSSSLHTTVTENKSYAPITTCVLEHILTTTNLCDLEKLYYMLADSLSLINHNKGKKRSITLSAKQWAEKLDCSVAEIFSMQQRLEQKGYFDIYRSKNKDGKNKKNTITPTLPDAVFNSLANTPNRFNIGTYSTDSSLYSNFSSNAYLPNLENKRTYLDRTKMFIKLNYDLLLLITSSKYLTKYAKVLWLDFYAIGYRYYLKHRVCDNNTTNNKQYYAKHTEELYEMLMYTSYNIRTDDYVHYVAPPNSYSLTTTYKELQDKYSCSKSVISKTLKELETKRFITRQRFFVKNDDEDDNLHDKSVWRITVTLPDMIQQHLQNEVKDRAKPASGSVVSNSDPYLPNSSQYINKYFISNTKDLDNIDSEKSFFAKTNHFSTENTSELSESYRNSLEKDKKEIPLEKEQKTIIVNSSDDVINFPSIDYSRKTSLPIINTQEYILDTETSNDLQEGKLKSIEEKSETVKREQEKTLLLNQLSEPSNEEEPINAAIENNLINTTTEIPVASPINLPSNSSSHNKSLSCNKPSTQAKSLKSFYPLSKEQVDKLNQLSSREFSNNFANQLLLKLYIRDPNKTFASTNHMISYMSKAFRYEKHQAPMVNHETFRFTANVSDTESVEMRQQEKYLREVEYSMDRSYISQLRKKIAGIFETKLAYRLLTEVEYNFEYQEEEKLLESQNVQTEEKFEEQEQGSQEFNEFKKLLSSINTSEKECTIELPEDLILTYTQKEDLENAIKSVYGNIDIRYEKIATKNIGKNKNKGQIVREVNLEDLEQNTVWYNIRKKLIDNFDEHIDKAWFSKLRGEENESNHTITLYSPSNFIRDYVNNKYGYVIRQIAKQLGYQFVELVTKNNLY